MDSGVSGEQVDVSGSFGSFHMNQFQFSRTFARLPNLGSAVGTLQGHRVDAKAITNHAARMPKLK